MPKKQQKKEKQGTIVFITGAAGYVGAMLIDQFLKRSDVIRIIALDKEPKPDFLPESEKLVWVTANLADADWQEQVKTHTPDTVIHAAWQIREMYGQKEKQWRWNVGGADSVFDFAFSLGVQKLIYFSTAAVYGAYSDNTIEHRFSEDEPMREDEYRYGVEKRTTEEHLQKKYEIAKEPKPSVFVLRPAAITGPRGRFMRVRFGLQSALSGQLKGSFVYRLVSILVSFVPAPPKWCRQFIHEDDVANIVALLAFEAKGAGYEVFNIVPPGPVVRAKDMARVVGKKVLPMPPWLVSIAFFFFWHITHGKIPTSRGGWKFYSYPVVMDGSKLTRVYGYRYQYEALEAFEKTAGRYEYVVPEEMRVR